MKTSRLLVGLALCVGLVATSFADQLDEDIQRPAGVLVKVDPQTKVLSVYKAKTIDPRIVNHGLDKLNATEKTAVMNEIVSKVARPENKIGELVQAKDELDRDSSTPAWFGRGFGRGWGYGGFGRGWGYGGFGRGWGGGYYGGYGGYGGYYGGYPGYFNYGGYPYSYGYGGYYGGYGGYGCGWYW